MKWNLTLLFVAGTLAACGELSKVLKEDPKSTVCTRVYSPQANVTNWTGAPVDIEMGYKEWDSNNYVDVQLVNGQSAPMQLRQYSRQETTYPNADCSGYGGGIVSTQLQLTLNSFSSVKSCKMNNRMDWVILVGVADTCPPYTTEQEKPL